MTSEASPIIIDIIIDDGQGNKKRMNVTINVEWADAIDKYASLSGVPKGEVVNKMAESFFCAPLATGKWRVRKQ
jgi:hypothetical protein